MNTLACLATIAISLSGCGRLIYADIDVPQICKPLDRVEFPAAPPELRATLSNRFEFDIASELGRIGAAGLRANAELQQMTLSPMNEGDNFDFIESATLDLQSPSESQGMKATIVHYQRGQARDIRRLLLAADASPDLVPYLNQGKVVLTGSFTGQMPPTPWSAAATVCAHVAASYGGH